VSWWRGPVGRVTALGNMGLCHNPATTRPTSVLLQATALVAVIALCVFAIAGDGRPLIFDRAHVHIRAGRRHSKVHGVKLLRAPHAPHLVGLPTVASGRSTTRQSHPPPRRSCNAFAGGGAGQLGGRQDQGAACRRRGPDLPAGSYPGPRLAAHPRCWPAGPHAYTAGDLAQYGALVRLKHHAALLIDNVFVSTNAKLELTSHRACTCSTWTPQPTGFASNRGLDTA